MLNYDEAFRVMNRHKVRFVLIGGLNFFLNCEPVATRDIDVFVDDDKENLIRAEQALIELNASWGKGDEDWGPVRDKSSGWLGSQSVHCLICDAGDLDVFTLVAGIDSFQAAMDRGQICKTRRGNEYWSLSREDMLACQLALPEQYRRQDRISFLKKSEQSDE